MEEIFKMGFFDGSKTKVETCPGCGGAGFNTQESNRDVDHDEPCGQCGGSINYGKYLKGSGKVKMTYYKDGTTSSKPYGSSKGKIKQW